MLGRKTNHPTAGQGRRPMSTRNVAYPAKPTAPPSIPLPEPPPTGLKRDPSNR